MRLSPRLRTLLISASVLAIAAAGTLVAMSTSQAAADTTDSSYKVWHLNIAGNTLHDGSTTNGLIENFTKSIVNRDIDFVAMNEVCRNQYKAMQSALIDAGWVSNSVSFSRFASARSDSCNGYEFGNAIFSRHPLGTSATHTLPSDGRVEKRNMLCAPLEKQPTMRFCTTHITTSNEVIDGEKINTTQLRFVNKKMLEYNKDKAAIIAGDFNAQPSYGRMNHWYSPNADSEYNGNNSGQFRELDDTDKRCVGYGEHTTAGTNPPSPCPDTHKKIDMIFAHEDHIVGSYSGDSLAISQKCGGPCSDHRIVTGTVTLAVP
ncbi:MAG TPA: endonuclease/exonuclease/phosphatase family protein [Candidatus Stackebrandtia faecavium]|nr:endonuclease/exonuclease/phosphatase family protein [Candidatus Stackebrandtia faecavium]